MTEHSNSETLILSNAQVEHKLDRIAYEIYESHYQDSEIIIIGISGRGSLLAEILEGKLKSICKLSVRRYEMKMDKQNPQMKINYNFENQDLKGKAVLLVDDVLNTGKTLMHAAKSLLDFQIRRLTTVILVNRRHRLFPIRADIVGLTLATTLKEHIDVQIDCKRINVFLK